MKISLRVGTVVIGGALVAGLVVGAIALGPAIAKSVSTSQSHTSAPAFVYPKNANGQTYGSMMHAISPGHPIDFNAMPDLISVRGVNGVNGYVRSSDFFGLMPKTPQQAVAMNPKPGTVKTVPVYAVDGKTVIGQFKIGTAGVTLIPPKS